MRGKEIAHPASIKFVTSAMVKEVKTEPMNICTHPISIRYLGQFNSKCMGCGEIITN